MQLNTAIYSPHNKPPHHHAPGMINFFSFKQPDNGLGWFFNQTQQCNHHTTTTQQDDYLLGFNTGLDWSDFRVM
jgi:hypothetical protein